MSDQPPFIAYFVVEADVNHDRDKPLFAKLRGPFPTRERAERERDNQQDAWQRALDEWDGENPYDFKGWDVVKMHLRDFYLDKLERMDGDSYETMTAAANAVAASALADEGIGPYANE